MENKELLKKMYNDAVALINEGKNAEAGELLAAGFKELPEELQGELLTRMLLKGLVRKVEQEDAIAAIQERGLELLAEIDAAIKAGKK